MGIMKFCPQCGSRILPEDRFCGDCGFDMNNDGNSHKPLSGKDAEAPVASSAKADTNPAVSSYQTAAGLAPGQKSPANKTAFIIVAGVLLVVFLGGGGLYWWLSRDNNPNPAAINNITAGQQPGSPNPAVDTAKPAASIPAMPAADLSRASTYLPEPGLSCKFYANFADGSSSSVERVNARVVSSEAVRVSEVEINVENGETVGYGFHYVERADGTYYIYDQTPDEMFPMLKNNLSIGQTWRHEDEYGRVVWKVVDMGVTLNLGFATLKNCLLVEEDNQAFGMKTLTYYAPGMGRVAVKSSLQGSDMLKLTSFNRVDTATAAETVKKWAPNYARIMSDSTQ